LERLIFAGILTLLVLTPIAGQNQGDALAALQANPVQAAYLARHPEILRWIGKHPDLAGQKAKNPAINEWVAAWPSLALLLSREPDRTLAWAEDPQPLAELAKTGRK